MKPVELKLSADGSSTLFCPDINDHYHSLHGAISESQHVFINRGLIEVEKEPLYILEIGFGTGLNALLTLLNGFNSTIFYHSIEKFPLPNDITCTLNYPSLSGHGDAGKWFNLLHLAPWNSETVIERGFYLTKFNVDLHQFSTDKTYDLVYFDAFAPEKQPDMWTVDVFQMLFDIMNEGAILTTYCAKGSVRRIMQEVGFRVERLKGPPGKREMIRASKPVR